MKAAIYARYSSDMQRNASIEDQSRNCRKRADADSWTISATFADAAISGSDNNRPQYKAMLAAADRSEFGVLLLDDLSRLARDSVEQERIIRRLEFKGLRIVATSDGYDSESKARKVHRGFKGLMNDIFLDDLREKTHRGLAGQHIKRFWTGGRPYCYRPKQIMDPIERDPFGQPKRIGAQLEPYPEQVEIVLDMFQRYADGEPPRAIADKFNARGIPSPGSSWRRRVRRCDGWMGSAIYTILTNDLYTGIRRDWAESALLIPVYEDVLEPDRVERMTKELQSAYLKCQRLEQSKAVQAAKGLDAIDERGESLRARLPDLVPDELDAALGKAEEKRCSLLAARPPNDGARVISMLPTAAADFREQIKQGLAGDQGASLKARVLLRQYFGGQIKLIPAEDGLYAEYLQHSIALLPSIGIGCRPWAIRTYRALVAALCSAAACSRTVVDVLTTLAYRICRLGEDAWERVTGFRGANRHKMSRLFRRHRRTDYLRAYRSPLSPVHIWGKSAWGKDISGWPGTDSKGSYGESIMKPELSVPNDSIQILRLPQVCIVTGLRRSMIYQLEAQQAFPRRIKIGIRAVGWIDSEVQAWVAQRVEASRRHLKRAT